MTFQTLTVPLLDANNADIVLESALTVARAFEALIDIVALRQRPLLPAGSFHPYSAQAIDSEFAALEAAEKEIIDKLHSHFDRFCAAAGITPTTAGDGALPSARFSILEGMMPDFITGYARAGDLSVVHQPHRDQPSYRQMIVESLIFQSARPVLVVPSAMLTMPERVLVAWDGSREAACAVQAAMPFLKHAREVNLLTIGDIPHGNPPADMTVSNLKRHNIKATAKQVEAAKGKRDFNQFLDFVENDKPDLLVLGGYSHNRWRELVLGGFTRSVINKAPCPLLMAH